MRLKNLINVLYSFLGLFNLSLEKNKHTNELVKEFKEKNMLNIYDKDDNLVGNFFGSGNANAYYINVVLSDLELVSKIYSDFKGCSSYTFRYDVISVKDNKRIKGFYKTIKEEDGKTFLENDYKLFEGEKLKARCKFDNIINKFSILDIESGTRLTYTKDDFELFFKGYKLFIHRYLPDIICYEKTNSNLENESNKAEGYVLTNWDSFDHEILNILTHESNGYFSFLKSISRKSDSYYSGLYLSSINKVLKHDGIDKKAIFTPHRVLKKKSSKK